jgi:hypothetical protein
MTRQRDREARARDEESANAMVTTAAYRYGEHQKAIAEHLEELAFLLAEHRKKADADPRNWGFAGDLAEIAKRLEGCVKFLNHVEPMRMKREG